MGNCVTVPSFNDMTVDDMFDENILRDFEIKNSTILKSIKDVGWLNTSIGYGFKVTDTTRSSNGSFDRVQIDGPDETGFIDDEKFPIMVNYCENFPRRSRDGKSLMVIFEDDENDIKRKPKELIPCERSQMIIDCDGKSIKDVVPLIRENMGKFENKFTLFIQTLTHKKKGFGKSIKIQTKFIVVRPCDNRLMMIWACSIQNVPISISGTLHNNGGVSKVTRDVPIVFDYNETGLNRLSVVICTRGATWTKYNNVLLNSIKFSS